MLWKNKYHFFCIRAYTNRSVFVNPSIASIAKYEQITLHMWEIGSLGLNISHKFWQVLMPEHLPNRHTLAQMKHADRRPSR